MDLPLKDRHEAGRQLAAKLKDLRGRNDLVVLGLPRGGVPVAYEIAMALGAPLDVFIVRKLGVPGHEELAMGAIATGHVRVLNDEVVREARITPEVIDAVAATEGRELQRRERAYRGSRPEPAVRDRTVILVDDGLATGSTMRAAVEAMRKLGPRELIVAVPVAAESTCRTFRGDVDRIVCMETPEPFYAIGLWYEDFAPTTDEEVRSLLAQAVRKTGIATLRPVGSGDGQTVPDKLARQIKPLTGAWHDYDHLLDLIGDARLVLIGEATHGTEEFYRERAVITRRLIEERGFDAVTAEADWPDAFRVDRYVRDRSDDHSADEALSDFQRFPQWMWRNTVVVDFVNWLRAHNRDQAEERQAAFYGLDLYSLNASLNAVVAYLDKVDPEAADRARQRYACFDHYADDPQYYGYATSLGQQEPCEDEVVNQLMEMRRHAADLAMRDGHLAGDEFFSAEQNARLAKNAEEYYRSMFRGRVSSWNLRDQHMAETLDAILNHIQTQRGRPAKVVVWAHNSHLGDARATHMGDEGELNLGQLAREHHPEETFLIGQTTYDGTVTAASGWDAPAERKNVRPGMTQSYEALFHDLGQPVFLLSPHDGELPFTSSRLQRAIGVIYKPETERWSHYFDARIGEQFDAVLHRDTTTALAPLERTARWEAGEMPETYPTGDEPLARPLASRRTA